MPGRFVRSKIAEHVAEVMGSRQGRQMLEEHGWSQGMPIVMAQPDEKLSDVMALVSVHQPPVLVATLDPATEELCFTYVALGCPALEVVDPRDSAESIRSLYLDAQKTAFLTFRISQLPSSAVAHALPPMRAPQQKSYHTMGTPTSTGRV